MGTGFAIDPRRLALCVKLGKDAEAGGAHQLGGKPRGDPKGSGLSSRPGGGRLASPWRLENSYGNTHRGYLRRIPQSVN